MSNTILIKRSGTPGSIPNAANVSLGELAINYADGNLFYKDGSGTVKIIASNQTFTLSGNIAAGNVTTSGVVSATGNVIAGNVTTVGQVSATGNVSGNYFIGNGRFLSGIDTTLISNGNSSVQTLANANITINPGGIANVVVFDPAGGTVTGYWSVTGNVTSGNLITGGLLSATGTATVGNVSTSGTISATGNVTAGNLITSGLVSVTGNVDSTNVNTGNLSLSGNVISVINSTSNITTTANIAAGGVLTDNYYYANGAPVDFQQAAGSNTQLQFNNNNDFGASANLTFDSATNQFTLVGTANVTDLNVSSSASVTGNVNSGNVNTGIVSASGNATAANFSTSGLISTTGNVIAGNVNTTTVSASGNITGGNLITNGVLSTTGNIGANNISIADTATATTLSATGSVVAGNITTAGTITATGNIQSNGTVVANTYTSVSAGITISPASGNINLFTTSSGNVILQNNSINNLAAPVQPSDAVTKQYVDDAVSTGITIHPPVRVESPNTAGSLNATYTQGGTTYTVTDIVGNNTVVFSTTASLNTNDQLWFANSFDGIVGNTAYFVVSTPNTSAAVLSRNYSGAPVSNLVANSSLTESVRVNSGQGATLTNAGANAALIIDGVTVSANDRVLIYNQTNAYENGVYDVTVSGDAGNAWVLTRSSDMDTYMPDSINGLDAGDYFFVQQGSSGAGESYVMTSPIGPLVIGYNNLVFTQFSASQVYSAANGIALTGTVFTANVDNDTTAIVSGNIVVKSSANLTTPNIGAATGTSLSLTGNVVAGNLNAGSGTISTTGNVDGGNVNTAIVSASGNITGANISTIGLANIASLEITTWANITSTTSSTNTTSGALIVAGGVGVAGNIYAGAMYVGSDSVLTINSTVDGGTY